MAETAPLDISKLMGSWYIVASTLPIWDGEKYNPRLESTRTGENSWKDIAYYDELNKAGKLLTKSLGSSDTLLGDGRTFTYRLSGLLFWISCKCKVLEFGSDYAIILFGRSLVTPPGLDIYRRTNTPFSAADLAAFEERAKSLDPAVAEILTKHNLAATKIKGSINETNHH